MKKVILGFLLSVMLTVGLSSPSLADPRWDHDWHRDRNWHGDIHAFRARDLSYWHSGHWIHGPHLGRNGWWWVLGPNWYSYAAPIYPYPNPYLPPVVAPVAANYAYYCHRPNGYYPYVPVCYGHWHAVPAY